MRRRHRSRRHRRQNPFRRRHRRARHRRNPGFFSGLLAPIKEHGIGFLAGEVVNHFVADPLLGQFLPASIISPSKVVVGPLLANIGKRFLPRFSRHWDSLAIYLVALGVHETAGGFLGTSGTKGLGWRGFGSIGPTQNRGFGSIGPTQTRGSIGALGLAVPNAPGNTDIYGGAAFGTPKQYEQVQYGGEY